jgi:hypothetical protein
MPNTRYPRRVNGIHLVASGILFEDEVNFMDVISDFTIWIFVKLRTNEVMS